MKLEKLISSYVVYSGKIFDVEQRKVELPDGRKGLYDIVKSPNACAIVAIDEDDNVVMVKQYRQSAQRCLLEIPAGKIDKGEDPKECALRELQEETGYKAKKIEKLFSIRMSPGFCTEVIHIYKATQLTLGKTDFDENEFIETIKIPLNDICDMIKNCEIEDAKTISGILTIIKR